MFKLLYELEKQLSLPCEIDIIKVYINYCRVRLYRGFSINILYKN